MIRRLALVALIVGLTIGGIPRRQTHAAALTNVTIALNWITNVEFAGIWVAQEKGWWKDAGLNVTVRGYDFTNDPVVLVGAGKYQFGFQDGASLIIARGKGIPLKAVWASGQKSPFAFITMPNSGITTPLGFKGKVIGYQAHERYVLDTMLSAVGLTEKDVHPQVVGFDPTVLVARKVDAYLAYITNEPIELAEKYHLNVNIIPASKYGYDFYSDVLFTTDSVIKSNPMLVKSVVAVIDRGWKYALTHPAEVADYVVTGQKLDKNDSVMQQTAEMKALAALASLPGSPTGSMTSTRWTNGITLLAKYGQIKAAMPAANVFSTQFLPH